METEHSVSRTLIEWIRRKRFSSIVLSNIVLLDSRWESDVIEVSEALYFTEYEVKVSIPDWKADFQKTITSYSFGRMEDKSKHELYSAPDEIRPYSGQKLSEIVVPKPAKFVFVTPAGLLDGVEIPAHCGHYEISGEGKRRTVKVKKKPPRLKNATQLNIRHITNIAYKACLKAYRTDLLSNRENPSA